MSSQPPFPAQLSFLPAPYLPFLPHSLCPPFFLPLPPSVYLRSPVVAIRNLSEVDIGL